MAIPSTTVYICSGVRLNNSYEHTIRFNGFNAQREYFSSKVVKTLNNYVYLRKSWDMRVKATMDEALHWNYLYFSNPGFEWYEHWYYFITDVEYENDNTVILKLELDVMQTYHFRYDLTPCFVEREHVYQDNFGANTVEESLDVGDYIVNSVETATFTDWAVLLLSTVNLMTTGDDGRYPATAGTRFNNVFSGLAVYACPMSNASLLGDFFKLLDSKGQSDAIVGMWMYPQDLLTLDSTSSWSDNMMFKKLTHCERHYLDISANNKLDGYTPKNAKTRQYPYNFMYLTNNNGGAAVYKYEYFGDPSAIKLAMLGVISPEGIAVAYPLNYKGASHNYDEKLTLTGFPTCSWNSDVYKLWLAQTQNQRDTSMFLNGLTVAGGAVATVAGLATGSLPVAAAGAGSMIHAGSAIAQAVAQKNDKAIAPPQAHGAQSGSLNMAAGEQQFTVYKKSVDAAHAKIIDDYFSTYGYACKRVKTPEIWTRKTWNYIKTIGCNVKAKRYNRDDQSYIESSICTADLNKINAIFDKGITFWHDPEKLGDYTQDNSSR